MIKIYLAARYSRRIELSAYAVALQQRGFVVTSRWLDGHHELGDRGWRTEHRCEFALEDEDDLLEADVLICFTEAEGVNGGRGGRHVEFGIARNAGKRLIVVGHRENVFHCLPQVEFVLTFADALDLLCTGETEDR